MVYVSCFLFVFSLTFAATYRLSAPDQGLGRYQGAFDGCWLRKMSLVWPIQTLVLTIVIGLRFEVGTDWYGYVSIYESLYYFEFSDLTFRFFQGFEPGFVALNIILNRLGFDYYAIFLASALLTYGFLFYAMARDSEDQLIAIVALFGLGFVFWHTNHVRQAIAASIVFWSIRFLWERKLVSYFAAIAFATLFHYTAIVLIPLGLIARLHFSSKLLCGAVVVSFVFPFFGDGLRAAVLQVLPQLAPETYLSILERQAETEVQGTGLFRILQFLPAAALVFLFGLSKERDDKLNCLMNLTVFYLLVAALFSGVYGVFRIAIYLGLVSVLFVSCATVGRLGASRAIAYRKFAGFIYLFSFVALLVMGTHSAVPYKSLVLGL